MESIKLVLLEAHTYSLKIKYSSRAPKCTATSLNRYVLNSSGTQCALQVRKKEKERDNESIYSVIKKCILIENLEFAMQSKKRVPAGHPTLRCILITITCICHQSQ